MRLLISLWALTFEWSTNSVVIALENKKTGAWRLPWSADHTTVERARSPCLTSATHTHNLPHTRTQSGHASWWCLGMLIAMYQRSQHNMIHFVKTLDFKSCRRTHAWSQEIFADNGDGMRSRTEQRDSWAGHCLHLTTHTRPRLTPRHTPVCKSCN